MDLKIELLDRDRFIETQYLINKIFKKQSLLEKLSLRVYLNKKNKVINFLIMLFGYDEINYWVGIYDNQVIGTIGLYTMKKDSKEAYWLGWYSVDEKYRGMGFGKKLIEFSENKARKNGKKYLRLYTTDSENLKLANKIYEKRNYKIIRKKYNKKSDCMYIFRELKFH
jgi:GNAT superfamily N-acetyltransferase